MRVRMINGHFRPITSMAYKARFSRGGAIINVDENELRREANKQAENGISFIKRRAKTSNIKFIR